ncbi:EF-hand domain-containing family member C2 isoform X3 [Lepidochelys kempii]|uniref:EF-hand domain-containing family member C2 isoform X3 n=1 Tax=Lepidochelys kempii TaxID=8472 RepID=UPI003C6F3645
MALPLLPGNSFNRSLGKEKFHKSQHWGYCNKIAMLVGEDKPGIGGEPLRGQKLKPKYTVFPRGVGSDAPSWVAFDKQVLSFDAYFGEEVPEKNQELYRIRHCKIYFYLEDDTIQVVEPQVKNSGIPQGTIVRRHRIPLPPPNEDQFYTVDYFNINTEVIFYAQRYKIVDCDQFTKNFLRKLGVRLNPPAYHPEDPYTRARQKIADSMKPLRPYERFDTLRQFLEYDGHVLRFYCMWDDTESMFGDPRELILHYFLADDTIEIKEVIPVNSGRDAVPLFLNRKKLPKYAPAGLYQPGAITDRTVLNVFGGLVGNKGRYILDNRKTGTVHQEFYKDSDLTIGAVINVWGRRVKLCDCDEFTKEYYTTKYGIRILGGKFLERSRIKKPGQELFKSEISEYFKAQDLFVGAKVCFNGHNFLLVDADEYAFNYMEKHADEFPMANISLILNKLKAIGEPSSREIKQIFAATDPEHTKVMEYNPFRNLMVNITGGKLSEHEIMTIGRYYSVQNEFEMDINFLLAVAQEQLKKNSFEYFGQLSATFVYNDREKCGLLPHEKCRTICKSFRLPLADDLLHALLTMFEDGKEQVDYKKFVNGLNWRENPVPTFQTIKVPIKYEDDWSGQPPSLPVKRIKYLPLIEDVFGTEE